ncbi:MAG: FAD-dependent oxidoreductase [Alphaproteobacteria bacterium]
MDTYIPTKNENLKNNKVNPSQNIAIVGSGIAGLSAAWLLSKKHQVTIYEKAEKLGGHSNTININYSRNKFEEVPISVDTGFIVYNNKNYPNLTKFFDALDVDSIDSDMSLSISLNNGLYEYSGSGLGGIFGQKKNIINLNQWKLLYDVFRFKKIATKYIKNSKDNNSVIGDWLKYNNFSSYFIDRYIIPIASAIWSCSNKNALLFPTTTFLYFFYHHGLLNIKDRPKWKTVKFGSQQYIKNILQKSNFKYEINSSIEAITPQNNSVVIKLKDREMEYDNVIMACHADQSTELIKDADKEIYKTLNYFKFSKNKIVLHSSKQFMPKNKSLWSSWNYTSSLDSIKQINEKPIQVTYWMNLLQNIDKKYPLFVTLNPEEGSIDEGLIFKEILYEHPILDENALKGQSKLENIQGLNNIWFAGAWTKYGFHEDGIISALNIAEKLGIEYPWKLNTNHIKGKIYSSQ